MPRKPRSPYNPNRRVTSLVELSKLLETHRHTVSARIKEYGGVDLYDLFAVARFLVWHKEWYGTPTIPPAIERGTQK